MGLKKPCAVNDGTWVRLAWLAGLCGRLEPAVLEGAALFLSERFAGCEIPLK
jgi:hypothetical protein